MFAYPLAQGFLHLSPRAYGVWAGASIHEIAQAVAAAFQGGAEAGQFGAIAKLTRVAMMAPVVIALGEVTARLGLAGEGERPKPPFPWFLIGFLVLATFNSLVAIPHEIAAPVGVVTTFFFPWRWRRWVWSPISAICGLAACGRLALGFLASLFIGGCSVW